MPATVTAPARIRQTTPHLEPIEDTTRRRFIGGIGAAALAAAFLAACGDDDAEEEAGGDQAGFPVDVRHRFGTTTVERAPVRVVALGPTDEDPLLALGLTPVAMSDWWGNYEAGDAWPWAARLTEADVTVMPLDGDIHYEDIAAADPDLIIAQYFGMTEAEYERLSGIAPTIAQSADHEDWRTPWQVITRTIGRAVGRPEEAEVLVRNVDAAYAAVRAAHPEFAGKRVLYAERGEGAFTIREASEPRVQVFTNMGLVVPPSYTGLPEFGQEYTDEELRILDDADVVVWIIDAAGRAVLEASPLFRGLRVTREARHVLVEDETLMAAINWSTVLSLPYAIDALVPMLGAALGSTTRQS